jgi:hypothetical protein
MNLYRSFGIYLIRNAQIAVIADGQTIHKSHQKEI